MTPHPENQLPPAVVLDLIGVAVLVVAGDCERRVLYRNALARDLVPNELPEVLVDALDEVAYARRSSGGTGPSPRIDLPGGPVRVVASTRPGLRGLEVVVLRCVAVTNAEFFRRLNDSYGVTRREYEVLSGVRCGLSNRAIGEQLGIACGTVARHLERLRTRFNVRNRTELAHTITELLTI